MDKLVNYTRNRARIEKISEMVLDLDSKGIDDFSNIVLMSRVFDIKEDLYYKENGERAVTAYHDDKEIGEFRLSMSNEELRLFLYKIFNIIVDEGIFKETRDTY